MIQRKTQLDSTGCGLACVAMLGRIGYPQARALARHLGIGPADHDGHGARRRGPRKAYYTSALQLARMLRLLGAQPGPERMLSRADALDCDGILAINHNRRDDTWHWVVYIHRDDGGYVLDPNPRVRSERRTDLGRMRCRSFLPVVRDRDGGRDGAREPAQDAERA